MKTCLLGVLSNISVAYEDISDIDFQKHKEHLASVCELITILQNDVDLIGPQLIAIVQTSFAKPSLLSSALNIWAALARNASDDFISSHLAELVYIPAYFVELVPASSRALYETEFKFILQRAKKEHLFNLVPISREGLDFYNQAICQEKSENPVLAIRETILKLRSENDIVVETILYYLHDQLHEAQALLVHYLRSEDPKSNILSSILESIFYVMRKYVPGNKKISRLCAECVGVIGAIDPSRLSIQIEEEYPFCEDFENQEDRLSFVVFLINNLGLSYRSSGRSRAQGHLAYAIQELLKAGEFGSRKHSKAIQQSWERITLSIRSLITPLLDSKYSTDGTDVAVDSPVFSMSSNPKDWLCSFVVALISRIQSVSAATMFFACRTVVKEVDLSFSLLLLPYLILQIVSEKNEKYIDAIRVEFNSVLQDTDKSFRLYSKQVIFTILDRLNMWQRYQLQSILRTGGQIAKTSDSRIQESLSAKKAKYRLVANFLDSIPRNFVSKAAIECEAHPRALLLLETQFRAQVTSGQPPDQSILSSLLSTHAALGESDYVQGLSTVMRSTDVKDRILENIACGDWSLAFTCYEALIEKEPENVENHTGLVHCLFNLNHYGEFAQLK